MIYAVVDTNVIAKEDAYLVTGNSKHFPKTPIVVTPVEMLEILRREGLLLCSRDTVKNDKSRTRK